MAPCVAPWPKIDGTVRGPRSMAPCVARDRSPESPGSLQETLPGVSWRLSWRDSRRLSGDFPGDSPGDYDYDYDYDY